MAIGNHKRDGKIAKVEEAGNSPSTPCAEHVGM